MREIVEAGIVIDSLPAIIAGLVRCANGDLLASGNSGGDLGPGQTTSLVRSTDGGRSWGAPERTFTSVFVGGGLEAGCSLSRLRSGRLLLPYADGFWLHPGSADCERRALLFVPYSDDHGATWHGLLAQRYEGLEAFAFGRVVELPDGDLLLPLWGAYREPGAWTPATLRSRDGGLTWADRVPIADAGNETPIALLPDGRVVALIRGHRLDDPRTPLYAAWSHDGARTWSAPVRTALRGTSPSLHVAADGVLVAGFRSVLPGSPCHLACSADGGATWSDPLELRAAADAWTDGGYPVVEDLPDGRLLAVFHSEIAAGSRLQANILGAAGASAGARTPFNGGTLRS